MKTIVSKSIRWMQALQEKMISIKAEPRQISLGYALGVFLATTPLIGLKAFIALIVSSWLKWNKVSALIGVFHVNALTAPMFYTLAYLVGRLMIGKGCETDFTGSIDLTTLVSMVTTNVNVLYCLLAGGLVLGIPLSAGAYFLCGYLIRRKLSKNGMIHDSSVHSHVA